MHSDHLIATVAEIGLLPRSLDQLRQLALELALAGRFSNPDAGNAAWCETSIGDLAEVQSGNSIPTATKALKYEGLLDGFPYIATKDVHGRTGAINYDNGVRIPFDQQTFRTAPGGAVLVCAEGGSAGKKVGLLDRTVCYGNKLFALTPRPVVEPEFLLRLLQGRQFQQRFAAEKTGIIGGVALKRFKTISLRVPSLDEQRSILRTLTHLFAAFDQAEETRCLRSRCAADFRNVLISKLQEGASNESAAWLIDQFADLFDSPEAISFLRQLIIDLTTNGAFEAGVEFPTKPLAELISFGPKNGYSPKSVGFPTSTKTMSLSAVTSGVFDRSAFKYVDEVISLDSDLWVRPGDILVQRANTIEYVGVSARYTGSEHEFIYPDLLMRITAAEDVDGDFLHLALLSSPARAFMRQRATGTSGTMPKINQATVKAVPIRVPHLDSQRRLAALASELLGRCDELERALVIRQQACDTLVEGLFASVGHRGDDPSGFDPELGQKNINDVDTHADGTAEKGSDAEPPAEPVTASSGYVDDRGEEAHLVSAVVRAFFSSGSEPIGNFRLQKAVYFARRWLGDSSVRSDFLRKAAGPYNPRMRYSGGIAVAKQLGWIREAKGRFGFGHVPGQEHPSEQALSVYGEAASWVCQTFKLRKNEDWEALATIDYATLAIASDGAAPSPNEIIAYIDADAEWRPKLARLMLTEFKVQSCLDELSALFSSQRQG